MTDSLDKEGLTEINERLLQHKIRVDRSMITNGMASGRYNPFSTLAVTVDDYFGLLQYIQALEAERNALREAIDSALMMLPSMYEGLRKANLAWHTQDAYADNLQVVIKELEQALKQTIGESGV